MKYIFLPTLAVLFSLPLFAQNYQDMMNDYNYNFYEVVTEAEKYFAQHSKGKGSGYKGYLRWKNENESKFYPTGNRSNVNPYFVEQAFRSIKKEQLYYGSRGEQTSPWVELGPWDANNVTSHYSQGIGRVETFYVYPNNTNVMYLGSRSGGFWRTSDGGSNWECSTDTMIATGVNVLDASDTNPDSVLINLQNAQNTYSQGIYYSIDGGKNWMITNFNPQNLGWGGLGKTGRVRWVKISPFNTNLVMVGTDRGLYRSTDFMHTFNRVFTSGNFTQIDFHPTKPNVVYVYNSSGNNNRNKVFKSTNFGQTFTPSSNIPQISNYNGRLSVSTDCPNCVYFATNNGVWKSINEAQDFVFMSNPNQGAHGFAVNDKDTSNLIYGYVDLTASTDGGNNFNQVTYWSTGNSNHRSSNYVHADMRAAQSINGVFYVGTDGYLAKSPDGGVSWSRLNDGTAIREFYRFGLSQSDAWLSMAGSQDNGTSIYKKDGWIEWNGGDGMEAVVQYLNSDWMMGSWQYGNRNRTLNGGLTRTGASHGNNNDWIAPMLTDPNHQMDVYSFGTSLYKTTQFGGNWQTLANLGMGNVRHAAIAHNDSKIILASRNNRMQLSKDGGVSFTEITSDLPNNHSPSWIAFDPNDDNTVIITYDRYQDDNKRVYVSHDLCKTWENISYNLSAMPLRTAVIGFTEASNIYVGGERGVYYKSMQDTVWTLFNKDLPAVSVRELDIQWATNTLRCVAWGRGMWQTKLVDREDFPEITWIKMNESPTMQQPKEDLPIEVRVVVKYSGALDRVYLKWSKDSASLNNTIEMVKLSGDTFITITDIPEFPAETDMYFKVFAAGESNKLSESYKLHYEYRACNSRPIVRATISKDNLCKGESFFVNASGALNYVWDNGLENSKTTPALTSGIYVVRGYDAQNCAGVDSVTLTVRSADTRVTIKGQVLEAQATNAKFQWLNCTNNWSVLPGEVNKSFSVNEGGEFAVEVEQNGCFDTSACLKIAPTFITENNYDADITVYPNPTNGLVTLSAPELIKGEVRIKSIDGKLLKVYSLQGNRRVTINIEELSSGLYILELQNDKKHNFMLQKK